MSSSAEVLAGCRFIAVCNNHKMGFKSVHGIQKKIPMEVYQEGGLNTVLHTFPKAVEEETLLQLTKGCCPGSSHPFYIVGEKLDSFRIEVYDAKGTLSKAYEFNNVYVKSWEAGELDAQSDSLYIDKFELSYGEVILC